jgi:hypothetical protein
MKRFAIVASLVLLVTACGVEIGSAEMRKTVTPRLSIQEQYDDNIFLDPEGSKESDWITRLSPGINLSLEGPGTRMKLDCEAGFSFYKEDSNRNDTSYRAQALWDQNLSEHTTFSLLNDFSRSEDPIYERDGRVEDIGQGRRLRYRNNGEASLAYQFGRDDQVAAGYRNRYYDERFSGGQDSIGHTGFGNLSVWFGPRHGISLSPYYTKATFDGTEETDDPQDDFEQFGGSLALNYRWKPSSFAYARYQYLQQDYDKTYVMLIGNDDFKVHQGVLGTSMVLSPSADLNLEGGFFLSDYENRDDNTGFVGKADLSLHSDRATFSVGGNGGYGQDYFSSDNLGPYRYWEAFLRVDHQLLENLRVFSSGGYESREYLERGAPSDREYWRGVAGFSLSLWRWFTLSVDGQHLERQSDDREDRFKDNRATVKLTWAYPYQL